VESAMRPGKSRRAARHLFWTRHTSVPERILRRGPETECPDYAVDLGGVLGWVGSVAGIYEAGG